MFRDQSPDAVRHTAPHRPIVATRFGRLRIGVKEYGGRRLYSDLHRGDSYWSARVLRTAVVYGDVKMTNKFCKATIRRCGKVVAKYLKRPEVIRAAFRLLYWILTWLSD